MAIDGGLGPSRSGSTAKALGPGKEDLQLTHHLTGNFLESLEPGGALCPRRVENRRQQDVP